MAILLGFFHPLDWTGLGNGPQWVALGCTVLLSSTESAQSTSQQNAGIVLSRFFCGRASVAFIQQEQQGQVTHDSAQVGQVFIRFYRVGWLDFIELHLVSWALLGFYG